MTTSDEERSENEPLLVSADRRPIENKHGGNDMTETYASGDWHVIPGKEQEFTSRWAAFLEWTRATQPAMVKADLIQDENEPSHFISFAQWEDAEARDAWKNSEGFMQRFAACRSLCNEMRGGDYQRVVVVQRHGERLVGPASRGAPD
jgi:quinol monooxygenase YgiN